MSAKGAKSSDSSKKPSISAKIRCTLSPQGQRNQIKKGKSGRRLQEYRHSNQEPRTLISSMSMKMGIYRSCSLSRRSTTYPKRARSSDSSKKP